MSSVDERIVKMVFDNGEFMTKIAGTISSLTQLNKATEQVANNSGGGLSAMGKAFEQAEITATKAGFHISDVWQKVTNILEYQVAGKIIDVSKKIANAMTFEGVADGFKEYELKMGSVQTIMAGTGASLQEVNKYLEELNAYSDKTIYSFADMTNNIGKFTNAGVKLDDAVLAIKGIANEAARSGANANEASRAMYNFSQALSAGYVKLIDWKSIENANMATKEFKDTLLQVASAAGTVEKQEDGMYKVLGKNANGATMKEAMSATKNFNDSLAYQWMTTDVLTKTMKIYATDVRDMTAAEKEAWETELKGMGFNEQQIKQFEELGSAATDAASEVKTFNMLIDTLKEAIGSGWAQSWEIIVGDFEEAKELWTRVSNVLGGIIDDSSKARNELLNTWLDKNELDGRKDIIDAIGNAFQFLVNVIRPIGTAMKEVFPPVTAQQLKNLSTGLLEFSKRLQFTSTTAGKIRDAAKGFFSIFDIGIKFVKAFVNAILPAGKGLTSLGGNLLDVAANIGKFITGLDEAITEGKVFENLFQNIGKVVGPIFNFILSGAKGATKLLADFFGSFKVSAGPMASAGEILKKIFSDISGGVDNIKKKVETLHPLFEGISSIFKGIGRILGQVFKQIGDSISGVSSGENGMFGILTMFNGLLTGGILYKIFSGVKSFSSIGDTVSGVLDSLSGAISAFQKKVEAENLMNLAKAIAILAGSLFIVAMVDSNKLLGATAAISTMMFSMAGAMAILMKAVNSFSTTQVESTFSIFGKKLFGINAGKMLEMSVTLGAVSKALLAMGGAVLMMAVGLKVVSSAAEGGHLWDSFAVVSLLLAELTGVAVALGKWGGDTTNATKGLLSMSVSLVIMAKALQMISEVTAVGNAWESLAILGLMVAGLTGVMIAIDKLTKYKAMSMAPLISMAISVNLLVFALKSISDALGQEGQHIWQALGIVGLMVAGLAGVCVVLSKFAGFSALGGAGAILAATSLLIMVQALKQVSDALGQTNQHIWQGLGVIATSLLILAVGLTAMSATIPGAAGLLIASAALIVLGGALKIMGSLKLAEIGKALLALFGSLLLLSVGLTAMIVALPGAAALVVAAAGLTVLAGALKLFGSMKLGEIVKSLLTLTIALAGITVLATVLSVASPFVIAFSAALLVFGGALIATGVGLTLFSTGLTALVAVIPTGVVALNVLATTLLNLLPIIAEKLMEALGIVALKIIELGPSFTQATVAVIGFILQALVESAAKIGEAVLQLIISILTVLTDNIPLIAQAGADLMIAYMQAISEQIPRVVDEAYKCAIALIEGLATAIESNNGELISAVDHLMSAVIQAIAQWIVEFTPLGLLIPEEMKEGIMSGEFNVKDALDNIIKGAVEAIKGFIEDFKQAAEYLIGGLIEGFKGTAVGKVVTAAAELGGKIVKGLNSKKGLDENSPSKKGKLSGEYLIEGVIQGMNGKSEEAIDTSTILGGDIAGALNGSLQDSIPGLEGTGEEMMNAITRGVKNSTSGLNVTAELQNNLLKPLSEAIEENSKSFERNTEILEKHDQRVHLSAEAEKDLQGAITDNEKAMMLQVKQSKALANSKDEVRKRTEEHRDATLDDVKAMKSAEKQAMTLHERQQQMKDGEYYLTKETKTNTEATEENTKAKDENTEATKKSGKATKTMADLMTEASGVVEAFTKNYGELYKEFGDAAQPEIATMAIKKLAESTYKASLEAEKAVEKGKKTKESMEDLIKTFTGMKKKVYDSVKGYFEGDQFFQKFEVKTEMTMKTLLENMKSNIDGVTNWSNKLVELGKKGLDQGLLKQLGELGPKGFEYVNAFSNATTEEIQKANEMFAQAAVLPGQISDNVLSSYAQAGMNVVMGFVNGMNENNDLVMGAMDKIAEGLPYLKELLGEESPSRYTYQDGEYLVLGLANGVMNNTPTALAIVDVMATRVLDTISERLDYYIFYGIGQNIAFGLADGMSSEEALNRVSESATLLSETASTVVTLLNLIKSPSRLYMKYGDYIAQGLAIGMTDGVPYVERSAMTLSDAVRTTLETVKDIAENDANLTPVITPVLDLSGVRKTASSIRGIFPGQSISLASSVGIGRSNANTDSTSVTDNGVPQINFTQNNYSPKALSRVEIYRQTKNQVSMMKGVIANA